MTRKTWRNIFIGIIMLTIPCYLFGIFIYYSNDVGASSTATPANPSRTPINVTVLALTDPSLIVTDIVPTTIPTATPLTLNLTPIIPTFSNVVDTPIPFFTATTIPTRFVTRTSTPIPQVTNTPIPIATTVPTATEPQPILLPPTNTPSS
ncbi:MAG: hypothetical protein WBC91_25110 [Phototrophicaceae bacterium]